MVKQQPPRVHMSLHFTGEWSLELYPNCRKQGRQCRRCDSRILAGSKWAYARQALAPPMPICYGCLVDLGVVW